MRCAVYIQRDGQFPQALDEGLPDQLAGRFLADVNVVAAVGLCCWGEYGFAQAI